MFTIVRRVCRDGVAIRQGPQGQGRLKVISSHRLQADSEPAEHSAGLVRQRKQASADRGKVIGAQQVEGQGPQ